MRHPLSSPKTSGAASPVLAPNVLHMLCEDVARQGVDPACLLEGTGLSLRDLEDPSRKVSFRQSSQILRRALELLPDGGSALGLTLGSHPISSTFGVVGLAMVASSTLEEAILLGIEHRDLIGSLVDLSLHVGESEFAVEMSERYANSGLPPSLLFGGACAAVLGVCKSLVGPGFTPLAVDLPYPAPRDAAKYADVFDCPVRFGADRSRVVAAREWLTAPLQTQDSLVARQALEILRRMTPPATGTRDGTSSGFADAVRGILLGNPGRMPRVEEIAQQLHMSASKLRRRLLDEGVSFRELRNGVKTQLAIARLREDHMTNADAAADLGFSDVRYFRRVFKRWTGATPSTFKPDKQGD